MNICLYAYVNRNFGDDMMIRCLCKAYPQHNFILFSPKHKEYFDTLADVENLSLSEISLKQFSKICTADDIFIKIGGSMFIIKSRHTFINRTREVFYLRRAKKRGCRMAAIGCNTGPFAAKLFRRAAISELSLYDVVTVRDKASYDFVREYTKCSDVQLYPDILFGIGRILDNRKYQKENTLCISVFKDGGDGCYNEKMAQLADNFIEKTGGRVKLLVFENTADSDIISTNRIYKFAKHKENIDIVIHKSGDEVINAIFSSRFAVCTRFHSIIMSIAGGTAFIPVVYSNKSENLLKDIGYKGDIYYFDDMDKFDPEYIINQMLEGKMTAADIDIGDMAKQAAGHIEALSRLTGEG